MRYIDNVEQEKREFKVWLMSTNRVKAEIEKEQPQMEEGILSQKPKRRVSGRTEKSRCPVFLNGQGLSSFNPMTLQLPLQERGGEGI